METKNEEYLREVLRQITEHPKAHTQAQRILLVNLATRIITAILEKLD